MFYHHLHQQQRQLLFVTRLQKKNNSFVCFACSIKQTRFEIQTRCRSLFLWSCCVISLLEPDLLFAEFVREWRATRSFGVRFWSSLLRLGFLQVTCLPWRNSLHGKGSDFLKFPDLKLNTLLEKFFWFSLIYICRVDLANVVRRRGYKFIRELLASSEDCNELTSPSGVSLEDSLTGPTSNELRVP